MSGMPWFRMYAEFATDQQVQILAFEDQRHFVMLLCMKGSGVLDKGYVNEAFRERIIAATLGLDPVAAGEAKRRLNEVGLIDEMWQPRNWEKRQAPSDHSAAGRMRNMRARKNQQLASDAEPVTGPLRNSYGLEEEEEEEEEGREEGAPRKRVAAPRGSRLPEDFRLTPERRKAATDAGVKPEATFEEFRDYWIAVAGQRGVKLDWDATWRNWCRRQSAFKTPQQAREDRVGEGIRASLARIEAHAAAIGCPLARREHEPPEAFENRIRMWERDNAPRIPGTPKFQQALTALAASKTLRRA